jgi:hypothetical protein
MTWQKAFQVDDPDPLKSYCDSNACRCERPGSRGAHTSGQRSAEVIAHLS